MILNIDNFRLSPKLNHADDHNAAGSPPGSNSCSLDSAGSFYPEGELPDARLAPALIVPSKQEHLTDNTRNHQVATDAPGQEPANANMGHHACQMCLSNWKADSDGGAMSTRQLHDHRQLQNPLPVRQQAKRARKVASSAKELAHQRQSGWPYGDTKLQIPPLSPLTSGSRSAGADCGRPVEQGATIPMDQFLEDRCSADQANQRPLAWRDSQSNQGGLLQVAEPRRQSSSTGQLHLNSGTSLLKAKDLEAQIDHVTLTIPEAKGTGELDKDSQATARDKDEHHREVPTLEDGQPSTRSVIEPPGFEDNPTIATTTRRHSARGPGQQGHYP